ncbi:MAG: phosphoglycerate mutase (2,3-diphosphoglycerate-independent) [Bdellovibrionales bacterium GWB1_55_8]|nr:MAG: phosphoglycerate mutase (2,3-diphosphoglycerate-independent) [Bdellovibrionales bacterium GWB1_55_8]
MSAQEAHKDSAKRALLLILDGFGTAKDGEFNAIRRAKMPFYHDLVSKFPAAELTTHGEEVGLPAGVMGNSEVGHTTIGAGRIVYQDLTRISKSIREGDFFRNPTLKQAIQAGADKNHRVHLMGLLSDGGVHSHIDHLLALLDFCEKEGVQNVSVHAFLDGRDTPPDSSTGFMEKLLAHRTFMPGNKTKAVVATVMGRYFAMDRDKRWDRVARAYEAMSGQVSAQSISAVQAIAKSHKSDKTDEFVEPVLLDASAAMKDGDSVIFFNYRADRAREITTAITAEHFTEFDRGKKITPSVFAGMTLYDKNIKGVTTAFPPQSLDNIFGEWLEKHGLTQFRTAETEKYAHVTFFFNGGREQPFKGEDRKVVPSPRDVATYDLKPEMSAVEVAHEVSSAVTQAKHDFVLVNFANPDMVGHTGNIEATIRALETLDRCLMEVVPAARKSGYHILLTADHGNAEEMRDSQGRLHTQHTLNPVPILWIAPEGQSSGGRRLRSGGLQDIMPTLCELMNLPLPAEVTGKSLLT